MAGLSPASLWNHPVVAVFVLLWGPAIPAAAGDDIDTWISQLAAPQYARREAAARSLVAAGSSALAPLEKAIRSGDTELAARGVEILATLLDAEDSAVAAAAESGLRSLAEDGVGCVAPLAADALAFHALAVTEAARSRLESLGAIVRERQVVDGGGLEIEFDASWQGGPDDFRHLARLRGVVGVGARGMPVDAAMIDVLAGLESVRRIDLYGTGAGPEQARLLAARLPDARIDVRKGGRLGVTSTAVTGPCEIRTVEPGSAADQAGLRSGDVVLSIEGEQVENFDDLTRRLDRHAAGAAVRVVVARRGGKADGEPERIDCVVRLDAW